MAGQQLNELPVAASVADIDLMHIQVGGLTDQQATKLVLLQEIQALVDANTAKTTSVIPHTVSGTVAAGGRINQLRDSGSFTIPLANTVLADVILVVELPDTYKAQTPVLTVSGGDMVRDGVGLSTTVPFSGAVRLTFTSDGISEWVL